MFGPAQFRTILRGSATPPGYVSSQTQTLVFTNPNPDKRWPFGGPAVQVSVISQYIEGSGTLTLTLFDQDGVTVLSTATRTLAGQDVIQLTDRAKFLEMTLIGEGSAMDLTVITLAEAAWGDRSPTPAFDTSMSFVSDLSNLTLGALPVLSATQITGDSTVSITDLTAGTTYLMTLRGDFGSGSIQIQEFDSLSGSWVTINNGSISGSGDNEVRVTPNSSQLQLVMGGSTNPSISIVIVPTR